jgi:two-component system cell cycle sensor histidine kinase/response regulator CckA
MRTRKLPSEAFLDAVLKAVGEAVVAVDPSGHISSMNRSAEILTGYSFAEASGKPFPEIAPLTNLKTGEPVTDIIASCRSGRSAARKARFSVRSRSGADIHVGIQIGEIPSEGESESPAFVICLRDESKQLAAEDALRDSETLYRSIVENSFDAIYLLRGKRYEYVNPRFCSITGYSFAELTSADFDYRALLPPEAREFMERRFRSRMDGEPIPPQYQIRVLTKSGSTVEVEVTTHPLESIGEIRVLGIMRDVTTRLRAEEELRRSEGLMKSIFASMVDSVFVFDEQRRFIFVNSPQMQLLMPPSEFVGSQFEEVMPACMAEQFIRAFSDARTGRTVDYEYSLDFPDGKAFFSTRLSQMLIEGSFCGAVAVVRDITEKKKLEDEQRRLQDQLRQTQKLESLGLLAGGVAHDFNNLLMGILGNAELAGGSIGGSSAAIGHIRQIEIAARKAADLCRQMLAYSGRGRTLSETVDLNMLIREMAELLKVSIPDGVTLRFDLSDDLLPILGDPSQLSQVVMNLITNAAEAISNGPGTITLLTRSMYCDREYLRGSYVDDELPPGIYVYLEVSDTGCGMEEATLNRIFDPFFTTKFTGRGLGLAAVLGIVRGHRGAIRVYSEPGAGTTFKIIIPPDPSAMVRDVIDSIPEGRDSGRILLVDDEEIVRSVVGRMLQKLGYAWETASDGAAALEMLSQDHGRFNCVILDMAMPGMDGAKVLAAFRGIAPGAKVVVMSGYNEREVVARLGDLRPESVLQKPFRIEALERALVSALDATTNQRE